MRSRSGKIRLDSLRALAAAICVGPAMLVGALPAVAQSTVGTEAELRAAFANPAETEIVLSADIDLTCATGTSDALVRPNANPLTIQGAGHTIEQTCRDGSDNQVMVLTGQSPLTIVDLTLTGGELEDDGDDPLGANGGSTETREPEPGSPLVDAIPTAACHDVVETDQRGVGRPQSGGCDIGAVEREPDPVNLPPVAQDATVEADEARAETVTITATDADGDALSYTVDEAPGHGDVTGDGPEFSYTSEPGFSGTDTFTVLVCDTDGACDPASVTVEVAAFEPPAEPPTEAGLTVDPDTAAPGDTVSVSGAGFEPGETVFLVLYSDPERYGHTSADETGGIDTTITIRDDAEPGEHTLAAFGEQRSIGGSLTITDDGAGNGNGDGDGNGNGGNGSGNGGSVGGGPGSGASGKSGLALTGADVLPLAGAGAALLITGGLGLLLARQRRQRQLAAASGPEPNSVTAATAQGRAG